MASAPWNKMASDPEPRRTGQPSTTNKRRFVTPYVARTKIPVFSADVYRGQKTNRRPGTRWMVEPQVRSHRWHQHLSELEHSSGVWVNSSVGPTEFWGTVHQPGHKQGLPRITHYTRGHLIPRRHMWPRRQKLNLHTHKRSSTSDSCQQRQLQKDPGSRSNHRGINVPSFLYTMKRRLAGEDQLVYLEAKTELWRLL